MKKKRCQNCKYWEQAYTNSDDGYSISFGVCKKYPIGVEKVERDYCGEYKPKLTAHKPRKE